ncbi:hypothetical protein I350_07155 [Cryptococcus amylolentus CBS 6273]|uniref:Uncharacterized protein n=1 Tax=Cryptococcus amylolentus CBS 6273 TaxID=1296118 RepID=A0A1E3JDQ1_9TREE|nr:hypothetical protein I350_07155 [Cryptococcus amylolentus CBS 6273]
MEAHYLHLANLDYLKKELDHTVATLDRLSRKGLLDPTRDYRTLTNRAAKSLTNAAGRLVSKDPDAVLHNGHREWNAADASRWANHVHLEADELETRGQMYYGKRPQDDEDANEEVIAHLNGTIQTLKDRPTPPGTDVLQEFLQLRHVSDGLRSQIISEQTLPVLVNRIYDDLAVAHPPRVSAAPSTRKNKNTIKWDHSFSDIEGARARLSASKRWPGDVRSFHRLEASVDELHPVLSEEHEKMFQRRHHQHLFNHPDGANVEMYNSSRIGDLGELLTNRIKHLHGSLNNLKDGWTQVTGHPGDFSVELGDPHDTMEDSGIANFGIPGYMILQSNGFDRVSQKLDTLVEGFKYEPETTVFRPSIAQSYLRSLVGLRDQVHARYDDFLRNYSRGGDVLEEGAERTKLLDNFNRTTRQLMASNRDAARSLVMKNDQTSRIETKYDEKIESLVRSLHNKVKEGRDEYERIHDEEGTSQSRVDSYRASADFCAAEGFLKEHYPTGNDNSNAKSQQQQRQLDVIAAKQLDMAWEASRNTEEEPVEELLDEMSLAPPEQDRPTAQLSLETGHTATSEPWKSAFNWADDEDDEEWWKEEMSKLSKPKTGQSNEDETLGAPSTSGERSDVSVPATERANAWLGSVPASRRLFG